MKWTVLSDNRTCNDLLQTEHGLSILLETDKHCILLDTGASDVFIRNAEVLGFAESRQKSTKSNNGIETLLK